MKINELKMKTVEEIKEDTEGLWVKDVLYGYHCNPSHPVPVGDIRIGIELESQNNKVYDVVKAQVFGVSNCDTSYIQHKGYENNIFAAWDSTYDSTATVEYVSRPIVSTDAPKILQSIYSVSDIQGDMETGNHFHVNKEDLVDPNMFGLLCVYLAPELKEASRRNFDAWNTWCSCRYKTLEDIEDMITSYFEEMRYWDHPLVRGSQNNPTMELRCFTTSKNLSIAQKQVEAFIRLVNMSNEIARNQEDTVSSMFLNDYPVNFLQDDFEDMCQKYDIYKILSEIAED